MELSVWLIVLCFEHENNISISLQLIAGSRWREDNDKFNGTQQLRFNFRLKFRSRTIHFDSLIARGKSHEGVPKSDTKAFNPESNFHL